MRQMIWAFPLLLAACGPLLIHARPALETRSEIAGSKFKVLATLSATEDRSALRVAANLRADLQKAGVNAIAAKGRWDTEKEAFESICTRTEQPVDGVLLTSYSDLTLVDCSSRKNAFTVDADPAEGGPGIREMTKRLVAYLHDEPQAPAKK